MKAACVVCGKEFEKRGNRVKCGQEECVRKYEDNRRARGLRRLREWKKSNPEKNRECTQRWRDAQRRKPEAMAMQLNANASATKKTCECVICGKPFPFRGRRNSKTCSPRCHCQYDYELNTTAAHQLGIPKLFLAAMKLRERFTQETANAGRAQD